MKEDSIVFHILTVLNVTSCWNSLKTVWNVEPFFIWISVINFRSVRKIRKAIIKLRRVCLSVRNEQLGFRWPDFHEIWYLSISLKSAEKIPVSLTFRNLASCI